MPAFYAGRVQDVLPHEVRLKSETDVFHFREVEAAAHAGGADDHLYGAFYAAERRRLEEV